jgi:CTP:molybdopterin cytidylyltransferase MocA
VGDRSATSNCVVIVLAGARSDAGADPVAASRGGTLKALIPVAGRAMVTRVLDAVARAEDVGRVVLVAPRSPAFDAAVAASALPNECVTWVAPVASPSGSVAAAFADAGDADEVLVVTADHPLLDPAWLAALRAGARERGADLAVALVPWTTVQARFPRGRRTAYRFGDGAVCGTNLFVFRGPRARAITNLWQRVEADRKRPWRIVRLLGVVNLVRFVSGRLRLHDALTALSERTGFRIHAVLLNAPESAVDVDTIADLECVEAVLQGREDSYATD